MKRKELVRAQLLAAHPEWKGRIWIRKYSVTVRWLGTVRESFYQWYDLPVRAQANIVLAAFRGLFREWHDQNVPRRLFDEWAARRAYETVHAELKKCQEAMIEQERERVSWFQR